MIIIVLLILKMLPRKRIRSGLNSDMKNSTEVQIIPTSVYKNQLVSTADKIVRIAALKALYRQIEKGEIVTTRYTFPIL